MKYYFACDENDKTYILAAKCIENARKFFDGAAAGIVTLYELEPDTFEDEGFLMACK